jgi:hypothetical protein
MRSETASINRHESSCGRLASERTRARETSVILNCAIVECGQRPPVLIDTSHPAEDSRQRGSAIDYYTTERGLLKIEHL